MKLQRAARHFRIKIRSPQCRSAIRARNIHFPTTGHRLQRNIDGKATEKTAADFSRSNFSRSGSESPAHIFDFFTTVRSKGGLIGVAVDPLTAHECGNQRYMAIAWLDACLGARLPKDIGAPLNPMPDDGAWLAPLLGAEAVAAAKFEGDKQKAVWLPNEAIAKAWMHYVKDTAIPDATPPPAPKKIQVKGNELTWEADADLESGIAHFIIERDGQQIATVPEKPVNPFGRPIFQGLQYSDTPTNPLVKMVFTDTKAESGKKHAYRVIAVNTVGLKSKQAHRSSL